jgi:hypothetical protein
MPRIFAAMVLLLFTLCNTLRIYSDSTAARVAVGSRGLVSGKPHQRGQVRDIDNVPIRHDNETLDDIFQFSYIPRPVIAAQHLQGAV